MVNSHSTQALEPVSLVELPRPGPYIPNPSGQSAFSIIKTYNHARQCTVTSLATIDLTHQDHSELVPHTTVLTDLAYAEAVWLDSSSILYLRPPGAEQAAPDLDPLVSTKLARKQLEKRLVELPDHTGKGIELWAIRIVGSDDKKSYRIGALPVPIGDLKFQHLSSTAGVLGFSASVYPPYDTEAFNNLHKLERSFEEAADGSTGQTYDSLYVRHWDEWIDQHGKEKRLFVIDLEQTEDHLWSIPDSQQPRSLFPTLSVPVGPFGSNSDFDLSSSSVVVTAKDPHVNPAWHTRQNIYIMPLYPRSKILPQPLQLTTGDQGATSNPVFSPSAKEANGSDKGKVAWLEMHCDGYESDQNQVVVYDLESRTRSYFAEGWDRSPSKIVWGKDDHELYLLAEEHGRVKVFYLSLKSSKDPASLTGEDSVSHAAYLGKASMGPEADQPTARLLLTMSSLAYGPTPHILTHHLPDHSATSTKIASAHNLGPMKLDEGEDFWFKGAEDRPVHGILIRPPGFVADQGQKWPMMFLIHGGPQGAWDKAWSLRWNPNCFAAAGYITAMINPTGSTGYGQKFTDSIKQDWGGKPYKDLVAGYEYLLKTYPEIDGSRTAALGASYGGYMVNWLMGHNEAPLGFKAFVSHDGIFNTVQTAYSTDELYFPEHDQGGTPVQAREHYEACNPMNHVSQWQSPCLVIHSRKDYRLCESEGLSVFNALQRRGIPSRFLYFPDENHWVTSPPNSVRWYHEIFRFLGKWCPPGNVNT
ncbi:hypothetical protein PTTG_07437 [Puccinia triticina 1-1 BBBD Race 1]|uniref:Dipeptidyl-peptidase V n=2 Tax=Puccinia triticina TaxID=208348 RepID=A0A180GQN4_PUCT1|nr:uncharacterized protein PtA15_14A354 [Puccinia triticina]OAV94273.1 hypothetical protein PTTG_07437 [Puccinia triticina 1-1 BBBD Race 1]WAQ91470.1 hypothetical protein PtA15_14A354 [Puccinia triticina]WAR62284.1 hypothetical protein PtB15_14B379 [Puccinia triticina]